VWQTDIAWKAAAGLALTEAAFHPTVLTLWRNKLRASGDPDRILQAVRAVIAETGVIAGKHRRVLDSNWDDPADVDRLVSELVDDANELVWAAEELELDQAQADAVALLALVAGQDVEPGDGPGRWRIAQRTAPDRAISTVDPETRHVHKTHHAYRDGYKAHVAASRSAASVAAAKAPCRRLGLTRGFTSVPRGDGRACRRAS
jgi:hypothetical protein